MIAFICVMVAAWVGCPYVVGTGVLQEKRMRLHMTVADSCWHVGLCAGLVGSEAVMMQQWAMNTVERIGIDRYSTR